MPLQVFTVSFSTVLRLNAWNPVFVLLFWSIFVLGRWLEYLGFFRSGGRVTGSVIWDEIQRPISWLWNWSMELCSMGMAERLDLLFLLSAYDSFFCYSAIIIQSSLDVIRTHSFSNNINVLQLQLRSQCSDFSLHLYHLRYHTSHLISSNL